MSTSRNSWLPVHDHVEEVDDVGRLGERGDAVASDALRVDHAVGAREDELGLGVVGARARDDEQLRVQPARRQHDVDASCVVVEGGDERRGGADAGGAQHVVLRRVAEHVRVGAGLEPVLGRVDHDHRLPGLGDLLGGGPADTAPAAHDRVVLQRVDVALHAASPPQVSELALQDELERERQGVEHGADAGQGQRHREDLLRGAELDHLAEADRRHGRDRLVRRVEQVDPLRMTYPMVPMTRTEHSASRATTRRRVLRE